MKVKYLVMIAISMHGNYTLGLHHISKIFTSGTNTQTAVPDSLTLDTITSLLHVGNLAAMKEKTREQSPESLSALLKSAKTQRDNVKAAVSQRPLHSWSGRALFLCGAGSLAYSMRSMARPLFLAYTQGSVSPLLENSSELVKAVPTLIYGIYQLVTTWTKDSAKKELITQTALGEILKRIQLEKTLHNSNSNHQTLQRALQEKDNTILQHLGSIRALQEKVTQLTAALDSKTRHHTDSSSTTADAVAAVVSVAASAAEAATDVVSAVTHHHRTPSPMRKHRPHHLH